MPCGFVFRSVYFFLRVKTFCRKWTRDPDKFFRGTKTTGDKCTQDGSGGSISYIYIPHHINEFTFLTSHLACERLQQLMGEKWREVEGGKSCSGM